MKKIISISIGVLITFGLFAQTRDLKPVSVGINFGGQAGLNPLDANEVPKIYEPTVLQLNAKGMLNETYGIMFGGQYQVINTENFDEPTNYVKLFTHAIVNLGRVMNFERFTKSLGLYAHGGIGASALWAPGRIDNSSSPVFDAADEMINFGLGLSPYFVVNKNWAVNLDYSYTFHIAQDNSFDMSYSIERSGIDGSFMTLLLGVSYHFSFKQKTSCPSW